LVAMDAILLPPRDLCAARVQVLVIRAHSANSMWSSITFVFRSVLPVLTSVSCIQVREAGIELYTIVYTWAHIFT